MSITFEAWPKTPRFMKESMVVTEKIDGTNAAIGIEPGHHWSKGIDTLHEEDPHTLWLHTEDGDFTVYAQSRNRLICPVEYGGKGADNYGFAEWVWANVRPLVKVLGPGLHFGEWWGHGIARNYGVGTRYFSLFNSHRWRHLNAPEAREALSVPDALRVVPVLGVHGLSTEYVREQMAILQAVGSFAAPGFMNPEGVITYLPGLNRTYKTTFDGDKAKWEMRAVQLEVAA